ncbi:MAG: hypothetical protein AAFN59_09580 [Pseudomonadota bacterium]
MIGSMDAMGSFGISSFAPPNRNDGQTPQDRFASFDIDGSGGLSRDEIEGTRIGDKLGGAFDKIDTNGDGDISGAEVSAFVQDKIAERSNSEMNGQPTLIELLFSESEDVSVEPPATVDQARALYDSLRDMLNTSPISEQLELLT